MAEEDDSESGGQREDDESSTRGGSVEKGAEPATPNLIPNERLESPSLGGMRQQVGGAVGPQGGAGAPRGAEEVIEGGIYWSSAHQQAAGLLPTPDIM